MDRLAENLSHPSSTQKTPVEYPIPRAISIRPDDFPAPLQDRVNENIISVVRGLARPALAWQRSSHPPFRVFYFPSVLSPRRIRPFLPPITLVPTSSRRIIVVGMTDKSSRLFHVTSSSLDFTRFFADSNATREEPFPFQRSAASILRLEEPGC